MAQPVDTFQIPRGSLGEYETATFYEGSRTIEQWETFKAIAAREDLKFFCGNPFDAREWNVPFSYKGHFYATWYDKKDDLHAMRISSKGRITKHIVNKDRHYWEGDKFVSIPGKTYIATSRAGLPVTDNG